MTMIKRLRSYWISKAKHLEDDRSIFYADVIKREHQTARYCLVEGILYWLGGEKFQAKKHMKMWRYLISSKE